MRDTTWATRPHDGTDLGAIAAPSSIFNRPVTAPRAGLLGLLLSLAGPALGWADPVPVAAKVVWIREARIYVAASDSIPLAPGDLVIFRQGRRVVGSGEVERVLDRHLAVVGLHSGSLARVKRPDRLGVLAERPAPRPAPLLRVGYPNAVRTPASAPCERVVLPAWLADGTYRTESNTPPVTRFVRDRPFAGGAPWPDTLEIRLFDEVTDQEIALERGELDVAVFWPGELSRHMREQPRWADPPLGTWRAGSTDSTSHVATDSTAAASIECPVLCEARLVPMLRALGADVLVNLLSCPPESREP